MTEPRSAQSSGEVYQRLLRGEADATEYVAALRAEARGRPIAIRGWAARWAETVVRAREAEAERDRYREALHYERSHTLDDATQFRVSRVLDQFQASKED